MTAHSTPNVRFLRHVLLPVVVGLLAAVLFVACEALPTDPSLNSITPNADLTENKSLGTNGVAGLSTHSMSGEPFYCVLSLRAGERETTFGYRYVMLALPDHVIEHAAGNTQTFTYGVRDERGQVLRQAICLLPAGEEAQLLVAESFRPGASDLISTGPRSTEGGPQLLMDYFCWWIEDYDGQGAMLWCEPIDENAIDDGGGGGGDDWWDWPEWPGDDGDDTPPWGDDPLDGGPGDGEDNDEDNDEECEPEEVLPPPGRRR